MKASGEVKREVWVIRTGAAVHVIEHSLARIYRQYLSTPTIQLSKVRATNYLLPVHQLTSTNELSNVHRTSSHPWPLSKEIHTAANLLILILVSWPSRLVHRHHARDK